MEPRRRRLIVVLALGLIVLCAGLELKSVVRRYFFNYVELGETFIDPVEIYYHRHGQYPENYSFDAPCRRVPGCTNVDYARGTDKDGAPYFHLTLFLKGRAPLVYDSRYPTRSGAWGTYHAQRP